MRIVKFDINVLPNSLLGIFCTVISIAIFALFVYVLYSVFNLTLKRREKKK